MAAIRFALAVATAALVVGGALSASTHAAGPVEGLVYTVDIAHSYLEFAARLVGFNRVRGSFKEWEGRIYYVPENVARSQVSVRIDVASISTAEDERDGHLKGADFFDVQRFPTIAFDSRSIRPRGDGFVAAGDLTIHGVTRPVEIPFRITSPLAEDPFKNQRFAVAGRLAVSRSEFGVNGPAFWSKAIGDSIEIEFELGARRWNYDQLSWGAGKRTSIGQQIFEGADKPGLPKALREARDLWEREKANPAYNFSIGEYNKCAGRLAQRGRLKDAADVLEQGLELQAPPADGATVATVRCMRTELFLRLGDSTRAREEWTRAAAADSASVFVRVLRPVVGS